jgi:heme-degrading monooxygenase HmoA
MVIERVELPIQAGREGDFEQALQGGVDLLKGAEGCFSVTAARGVEQPSRYLLLIGWSSLEHHMAFTKTGEFTRFRELIVPFFSDKPAMHHFAPVIEKH